MSVVQLASKASSVLNLFSEQEIKLLGQLVAANFGLDTVLDTQQILAIASRSFAMAIISDISTVSWLRIPFTPVARHAIIEQRMNAFIAGTLDSLVLWPLFKMSKVPMLSMPKLNIPNYIIDGQQQRQSYVQTYCKAILAVYTFCEENTVDHHLAPSLNAFARLAIRIVHKRIRQSVAFFKFVDVILDTVKQIETYQNSQEYSSQQTETILRCKDALTKAKEYLRHEYMRNVEQIKNAPVDGPLIAARLLYYPFMKQDFKQETLFEIELSEILRMERIGNFSMNEQDEQEQKHSISDLLNDKAS